MNKINDIDKKISRLKLRKSNILKTQRLEKKAVSNKSKAHPLVKNLVTARRRLNISQNYISIKTGVSRATISSIELGKQSITLDVFLAYNNVIKLYDIQLMLEPVFEPKGLNKFYRYMHNG